MTVDLVTGAFGYTGSRVAERVLAFYGRISAGFATAYATSTATVLEELKEVRPTVFGSVPRIFEKAYGKITSELEKKPPAVRHLFAWALRVSTAKARLEHAGERVPLGVRLRHRIADRLVWRRLREVFGGRVRYANRNYDALEGAAALLVLTEWNEFRRPDFGRIKRSLQLPVIFDGRNIYDPDELAKLGFTYYSIGRKHG